MRQLYLIILAPIVFFGLAAGTAFGLKALNLGTRQAVNVNLTPNDNATAVQPLTDILRNGQDEEVPPGGADPTSIYGGLIGRFYSGRGQEFDIKDGKLQVMNSEREYDTYAAPEDLTGFTVAATREGALVVKRGLAKEYAGIGAYDLTHQLVMYYFDLSTKTFAQIPALPEWMAAATAQTVINVILPSVSESKVYLQYNSYSVASIDAFEARVATHQNQGGIGSIRFDVVPATASAAVVDLKSLTVTATSPMFAGMRLERYYTNDLRLEWDSAANVAIGPMDQNDCDQHNMLLRVDLKAKHVTEIGGNGSFNFAYDPDVDDCVPRVITSPDSRWFLLLEDNKQGKFEILLFSPASVTPKTATLDWSASNLGDLQWNLSDNQPTLTVTQRTSPGTPQTVEFR